MHISFKTKIIFLGFFLLISSLISIQTSEAVTNKLSGRILLQVQQNGEAWYVNPDNQKRYFLGRPEDAFALMRELGLGISENNYKNFENNNNKATANLSGKILLRVESNGEAYYVNPLDLKMHYLGRPADAFQVMRDLGLGITDVDLDKINTEEVVVVNQGVEIDTLTPAQDANSYTGSGTHNFKKGDSITDEINNVKWVMSDPHIEYGQKWMVFERYNTETNEKMTDFMYYLDPEKIKEEGEIVQSLYSANTDLTHVYFFTYNKQNSDGSYNLTFDFKLKGVLGDTAVGHKKILIVPAYFDDEYEVFDQFSLYRDTFLSPALDEIKAYLKVKQIEFLGEEIMTEDFTIADAVKLGRVADYLPNNETDNNDARNFLVKNYTSYNPDDFDVIAFLFFTEQMPENSYRNTARINQAIISYYLSPITEYELNTPIHPHQIRNQITSGLLHELLHIYGMSDKNGGGKYDFYEGEIYNGNQSFDDSLKNSITEQSQIGRFHKIDDAIADEIGWSDMDNNGIFDANEYFVN